MADGAGPGTDTQWPRWEVFKQDASGRPHQAVGSVHAADAEHALFTARSVFVRRPSAVSLWVAPASEILTYTAQEALPDLPEAATPPQTYAVFRRLSHKRGMTAADHVGEVEAPSAQHALREARARWPQPPALVWWIMPEGSLTRSAEDELTLESWFEPAGDKTYRQQSSYGTVGRHPGRRGGEHE